MDYQLEQTFDYKFTSRAFATGIPTVLTSGTIEIYEDNSTTQITGAETLTVDFDEVVGYNNLRIVATAANGFEAGKSYSAVLSVGTVGGVSVVGETVLNFTIERAVADVIKVAGLASSTLVELDGQSNTRFTAKALEQTPLSGGNLLTLNYVFSTTTTAADPGAGRIRFNNSTPASVTEIYISEITDGSLFVGQLLADMKAGDKMAIAEEGDATKFITVTLDSAPVDSTDFYTISVTIVDSGALIGNNRSCGVLIIRESQPVSVEQIRGDAQSAIDLKDFVDEGYDPATNKVQGVVLVDLTTANTDMRGTNLAALATVCTELRLAELDAANLPDDVDTLIVRIPDVISLTNIKAQVDAGFTTQVADSVAADGVLPTREQYLYMIGQFLMDFGIIGTTYTVRKVDGSTALMTFTLDDATNPTDITRT